MSADKLDDYIEGISRWIDADTAGIYAWTAATEYADAKYKKYLEEKEDAITGMTAEERRRVLNDNEYLRNLASQQDLERAHRASQCPNFMSSKENENLGQEESEMVNRVFAKYPDIIKMIDEIPTDEIRRLEAELLNLSK